MLKNLWFLSNNVNKWNVKIQNSIIAIVPHFNVFVCWLLDLHAMKVVHESENCRILLCLMYIYIYNLVLLFSAMELLISCKSFWLPTFNWKALKWEGRVLCKLNDTCNKWRMLWYITLIDFFFLMKIRHATLRDMNGNE